MESSVSSPSPSPSMEVWHFQIAVYFAFGFFFLRLFLDRFVFQVSKRIFQFLVPTEAFIAFVSRERLVLNSPLIYLIMYMRWHLKFFNKYEILIVVHLYQSEDSCLAFEYRFFSDEIEWCYYSGKNRQMQGVFVEIVVLCWLWLFRSSSRLSRAVGQRYQTLLRRLAKSRVEVSNHIHIHIC